MRRRPQRPAPRAPTQAEPRLAGRIPQSTIDEILRRVSITSVIGEVVQLTKRGHRQVGLCPFHDEKTPSFHVNEEQGFYHCFGCKASGNALKFLMEHHGLGFLDAIGSLADRAGVALEREEVSHEEARRRAAQRDDRTRALRALSFAERAMQRWLWEGSDDAPRAYLRQRGVDRATADAFGLGWAPSGWTHLLDAAVQAGHRPEDLTLAGLVTQKDRGGHYDRFRQRVMFPVRTLQGEVVAFSGRTLDPEERAKYINTAETPWYTKGRELFGLVQARKSIRDKGEAVLVEGNFDVVSLHARGITQACASLGTAFTVDQARTLRRLTQRVTLFYDGDEAGATAAEKTLAVLLKEGFVDVRRVDVPQGRDPDDLARALGADGLASLVDSAHPMLQERLDTLVLEALSSTDPGARGRALRRAAEWLILLPDPLVSLPYQRDLARRLQTDPSEVKRALLEAADNQRSPIPAPREPAATPRTRPATHDQDASHLGPESHPADLSIPLPDEAFFPAEEEEFDPPLPPIQLSVTEAGLVQLFATLPQRLEAFFDDELDALLPERLAALFRLALEAHRARRERPLTAALDQCEDRPVVEAARAALVAIAPTPDDQLDTAWRELVLDLKQRWYHARLALLASAIDVAEAQGDLETLQNAIREMKELEFWCSKT